jgi:hypothetical protein
MKVLCVLLIGHAVLLTLACTDFSIINWMWGGKGLTWDYFVYAYRNGWGYDYVSEYGLGQVLCYAVAYGLGVAAFSIAWLSYRIRLSALATVLCAIGALSFLIELTHWITDHHLSWIASFPIVMAFLLLAVGWQVLKTPRQRTQPA